MASIVLLLGLQMFAVDPKATNGMDKVIPLFEENTFAVLRILPSKLDVNKAMMPLVQKKAIPVAQAIAIMLVVNAKKAALEKVVDEVWLGSSTADASRGFVPRMVLKPRDGVGQQAFLQAFKDGLLPLKIKGPDGESLYEGKNPWITQEFQLTSRGDLFVLAVSGKPKEEELPFRPEWRKAWKSISDAPVQLILVPNKQARQLVDLIRKEKEPAGRSAFRAANIGLFVDPWKVEASFFSEDMKSAREMHQYLLAMIQAIPAFLGKEIQELAQDPVFKTVNQLVQSTKLEDDYVKIVLDDFEPVFQVAARVNAKAQEDADLKTAEGKLKQIGQAVLAYEKDLKSYPPAFNKDADGKPLLSWRVHILPYLGNRLLYRQFHLNEPWDSEHNKRLIRRMPLVFKDGMGNADRGETAFVGLVGANSAFDPDGVPRKAGTFSSPKTMIVQTNSNLGVIWTKPDDLILDGKEIGAILKFMSPRWVALFSDGSTRVLQSKDVQANPARLQGLEGK